MSSSRPFPKNIYSSKRRQRSISNPHGRPPQSSSPLKVLSTEDEDITVTEMSLRMKKRSRSGMKRLLTGGGDAPKAASVGTSPAERADARPNKKSKIQRTPLAELDRRDSNIQSAFLEDRTQDMDLTNCAEIKTPAAREAVPKPPKLKAPADDLDASEKDEESDFLSPLPFSKFAKRVIAHRSSSSLREASQKSSGLAGSLASPFNSRPGSPGHLNLKAIRDKTINRTRSVQNDLRRRAALRSFSRAESPSSNASSPGIQKSSESWSVPDHIKQSISQKTPRRPSATGVLPNSDTSFSFSPIACSTPIKNQNSRLDINATPRFPSFDLSFHSEDDMALDDPTPRASAISESLLAQKPDMILFPNVQERISSAETNKSRSSRRVLVSESLTIAPPVSPTSGMVSPMTSDGDELRDMFSILGLDGECMRPLSASRSHFFHRRRSLASKLYPQVNGCSGSIKHREAAPSRHHQHKQQKETQLALRPG